MRLYSKQILSYLLGFLVIWTLSSFFYLPEEDKNNPNETEIPASNFFSNNNITDGPYIFMVNNNVKVTWINGNKLRQKMIYGNNFKSIQRKFGFEFQPEWIDQLNENKPDYFQRYDNVKNFIAISDIHGQFDVMIQLLKSHKVIDEHYNWIFNDGHLIVLGDILDRGPQVTESLWFIFRLEQQAIKSGGKVHIMLGNHELMVLNNDVRYINDKYIKSAQLMGKNYSDLYSENSFLGKWLRQKPIMVTINDILFVHAGVSTDFITKGITRTKTNEIFAKDIIGQSWDKILNDSLLTFFMSKKGPVWYRGYFDTPILKEYQVDHLLRYFNVNHIIVGHTSFPNIVSLYNGKIYGIDSSIKLGNYGELLIYENSNFYRGTSSGSIMTF